MSYEQLFDSLEYVFGLKNNLISYRPVSDKLARTYKTLSQGAYPGDPKTVELTQMLAGQEMHPIFSAPNAYVSIVYPAPETSLMVDFSQDPAIRFLF